MNILLYTLHSPEWQALANITEPGKRAYAARHGWEFRSDTIPQALAFCGHMGFGKIKNLVDLMQNGATAEWIWWTGCDVLITNPEITLESIIGSAPANTDLIICNDSLMWSADSFLIRVNPRSRAFLNAVLDNRGMRLRYRLAEQEIMWNLKGMLNVHEAPQRTLNSYFYEFRHGHGYTPENARRVRERKDLLGNDGQWQPGDFVIHLTPLDLRARIIYAGQMAAGEIPRFGGNQIQFGLMDSLIIQLGKTSEVLALLPLAYAGHKANLRVGMMVCREFADCLDGASYVKKVVFDGQPWQLPEAVEQARKLCQDVVVTQVNGPKEVIAQYAYSQMGRTRAVESSFDRESWNLAGVLNAWGKFPLVFDQRNAEREQSLLPASHRGKAGLERKLVLLALDSVMSPFPYKDQLWQLLTLHCPNFQFVDLCQVRAERFHDLLGLYEAAHCLITVDTAHLHLAPAVPTLPVMALIQDAPDYWHGTAWRPQHHFYCRYHDFPWRAMELFTAIHRLGRQESPAILAYHGGLRDDGWTSFAIQPGSCHRDSANCLNDQAHFPMLRDAIEMFTQTPLPHQTVILVRSDTKFKDYPATASACQASPPRYAYRMNRDQAGHDTFFPAADLFAARVEFWKQILPELPDICMDDGAFWSRALLEVFKMHGAREIEGIYRES